jgi:RNA polymerase sigma factor (sigma-70 family)
MYSVCRAYSKDDDVILSLINDSFLKVFQNIKSYRFTGSFEGWLKRIMYHTVIDHFRNKDKKLAFLEFAEILPETITHDNALHTLIVTEMYQMFEYLPENTAKALKLFALEGYSHAEISKILNISEGNSRWHVSQARNLLQEKLKSYNKEIPAITWK